MGRGDVCEGMQGLHSGVVLNEGSQGGLRWKEGLGNPI